MTTTRPKARSPPPPTPCIDRPVRSSVKFLAKQQSNVPMVKKPRERRYRRRRPNISDKETMNGWKTACARR